jgi:hypothetical protein
MQSVPGAGRQILLPVSLKGTSAMRVNVVCAIMVIAASAIGCQSAGAPKMPQFSWWKKTPPASAMASTTPAGPQLPSTGTTPPVTTPTLPSTTASATYPEQPASAETSYPTTAYPATATPAAYTNNSTSTPAANTGYTIPSYSAASGAMPTTNSGVMAPQNAPYSPIYNRPAAVPAGAATATYPSMNYASPQVGTAAESTGAPPAVVSNQYADTSSGAQYPSTSGGNYGSATPDTTGTPTSDNRYANRTDNNPGSASSSYDGRYDSAPSTETATGDRYSSGTTADSNSHSNSTATVPNAGTADRSARDSYQPGNYQPGNTGYEPGNTGYNPPGVDRYQSAAGGATNYATTPRRDPFYRPGDTSDYRSTTVGSHSAPAGGSSTDPYASPSGSASPATSPSPYSGDRYGTNPASRY